VVKVKTPYGPSGEDASVGDSADRLETGNEKNEKDVAGPDWLKLAQDAYEDSTKFLDSSLRSQWEKGERSFQNRHPSGSKYLSESFKARSKLFRPKTRATIRQGEAQAAASFFSNEDAITVRPSNDSDHIQRVSADINKELLQYRLTVPNQRAGIPWFMTVVGAYQDARKYGVVISKQWWEYEERIEIIDVPAVDQVTGEPVVGDDGLPVMESVEDVVVLRDRPRIDVLPPENVRIDRGADWRDPINTSPFVIILTPMYIHEVEERMDEANAKNGQPVWKKLGRAELKAASSRHLWDSTRSHREGHREDSKESEIPVEEFSIVWVHENIIRWKGRDWVYYTAGVADLLSDPVPLEEIYRHCKDGDRPVVMGYSMLETNKTYPGGVPQLTEGLQAEANDVVNLRLDNVKLALGKRYLVKRGKQVDLRSILRNTPGSATLVSDTDSDVKVLETRDVTQSSYMEQDRINADFDDVVGSFSTGTVQTNRRMNETVGGMEMLSGSANLVGELDLRVFTETWVEPVLRQILRLEQTYETDEKLVALAGEKAQVYQKFGVDRITDKILDQDLTIRVNVGIGATDPMQRLNKFRIAAESVGAIFGDSLNVFLNIEEVIKEIFGPLGYRDGKRFFKFDDVDPMVQMLQQQIEELNRKLETKEIDAEAKVEVARMSAMSRVLQQHLENQGHIEQEDKRATATLQKEILKGRQGADMEQSRAQANRELETLKTGNEVRKNTLQELIGGPNGT